MAKETTPPERWEVAEMIRGAIEVHETKKESNFVTKTEFTYANQLRDQAVDKRLKDLEDDATDAKDRNKWLFRLVIGAIIVSLIPVVIALISQAQGNILK
jgi:hypothetical protein